MSSNPASPIRRVWYKWKALRLPWRRKFLVGLDLSGNTYWEFRDTLTSNRDRMRRIVKCNTTIHYSNITSQISPAWHQWLRHTRRDPPSLTEQAQDISRQEQLKVLAARADARWVEKQDILDSPRNTDQPIPTLEVDKKWNKILSESRREGGSGTGIEQGSCVGEVENIGQDGVAEAVACGVKAEAPGENRRFVANKHRVKEGRELELKVKEAPWKITKGSGEGWQPQTWDPNTVASQDNK